jgi:hypothetical protein
MPFYKEAQLLVQCLKAGKLQSSLLSNSKYVSNPDIITKEPVIQLNRPTSVFVN